MYTIIYAIISLVLGILLIFKAIFMSDAKIKFYSRNRKNELCNEKLYFMIKRVITLFYAGYIFAMGIGIIVDQDIHSLILVGIILIEILVDRGFYNDKV